MDKPMKIKAALAPLFAALTRRNADEIDAKSALAVYIGDLQDLPLSAIEQACTDFRRGSVGDGIWCPTSAQIRQEALKIAARNDRIAPPSNAPELTDERLMRQVRIEARRIASRHGLTEERMLQAEWTKFVEPFRALGATKLRWYEEWAKHCASYKHPYRGINSDDELRECF